MANKSHRTTPLMLLKRAAAAMLLFSFLCSPFLTHAQEFEQPAFESTNSNSSTEDLQTNADGDGQTSNSENIDEVSEDFESVEIEEENISAPTEDLPEGEGLLIEPTDPIAYSIISDDGDSAEIVKSVTNDRRFLEVDEYSGSVRYSVPIESPPGRNKSQPDISLEYSSQVLDGSSIAGYGWRVNIPYIERRNVSGIEDLYSQEYFYSSLSGQLATTSSSTQFRAETDNGEYLTYVYDNNNWTVFDKQGNTFRFGNTSQGQINSFATSTDTYLWMLNEVMDANGNYVTYEYLKSDGQVYPDLITYTNFASSTGPFEIEFSYELRPDISTSTIYGFPVVTKQRLIDISVKENGSWVKKYDLEYTSGENGNRSLLNTIVKSGKDSTGNVIDLPAIDFTYETSTTTPVWGSMSVGSTLRYSEAVRYGDINGDGLTDIVYSNDERYEDKQFYINRGGGDWESVDGDSFPVYFFWASNSSGDNDRVYYSRLVDLNGDMLADVYDADSGTAYINNGDLTWTENSNWYYNPPCSGECVQLADVNGDRLVDLIYSWELRGTPGVDKGIKLNTGTGWGSLLSANGLPDGEFYWESNSTCCKDRIRPINMIDVNGDGLADYLNGGGSVSINMGNLTWEEDPTWAFEPPNGAEALRYGDINNDGLIDIMSSYRESYDPWQVHVFINQGDGWVEDSNWANNFPSLFYWYPNSSSKPRKNYDRGIADFDGDGAMDILDGSNIAINRASHVDLLTGIENIYDGDTIITYTQSALEVDTSGDLLNPRLPQNLNIVSKIKRVDSFGTNEETTYSYEGGDFYYENFLNRKFAGFGSINEISEGREVTMYFHQGNETSTSTEELEDDYGLIGRVFKEVVKNSLAEIYSITTTDWNVATQTNSRLVTKAAVLSLGYDGNISHKDSAVTYDYDSVGNLVSKHEWGEVNGSENGNFSDLGNDAVTSTYTYASSTYTYLNSSELIQNSSSSLKVKETRFFYDSLPTGQLTKGNLTKKQEWIDGNNYANTENTYNEFGMIASSTDPRGNTTSYEYDSMYLYPETVTNPLGHAATFAYDYSSGKIREFTDPNGYLYESIYDGLDRLKRQRKPDSTNPANTVITEDYDYYDNAIPVKVKKSQYLAPNINKDTYYYLDGMGRIMQKRSSTENSGAYSVKDTKYDSRGLIRGETLPYLDEDSDRTIPSTDEDLYTWYEYDALNRITLTENALGMTEHEYDDWANIVTDANGNQKVFYKDAFERLSRVDENNATSTYSTFYEYDELGNLTNVTDANLNVRNFAYDGLSRRLSAEDMHSTGDATYGLWLYSYDYNGNLSEVANPRNQTIEYTYDSLNRVLTEDYISQSGIEVEYSYDTCIGGVGKLCEVSEEDVDTTYTYSARGEVATINKTINGISYILEKEYDKQGNLTSITYPDGSNLAYLYNDANLIDEIQFTDVGQATSSKIVSVDYHPSDEPLSIAYGEIATSTYEYDPNKMYLLSRTISSSSAAVLQDSQYEYDSLGNITRMIEASATPISKIVDYEYDDLSRLISASTTASLYRLVTSTTTSAFSNGRDYFTKLSIPGTSVSGSLVNMPVYVNLADMPASFFSHASSGCGDIRVFADDMTTELPRQVVSCNNASSTGEMHFKANFLTSATTTNDFYIYYGTTTPVSDYSRSSTYGADNVWTDYGVVFHLNDNPGGTAPQLLDSSVNQRNATTEGSMTPAASVDMKLGKGVSFDNSNDSAAFTNAVPGTNPFVISFWSSKTSTDHDRVFSSTNTNRIFIDANFQTTFSAEIGWRNGSTNVGVGVIATSTYTDGLPHHVQVVAGNNGTSNRAKLDLYVDGLLRASAQSPSYSYNISSLSRGWWLGKTKNWSSGANEGLYGGKLDEVRFYNGTTSPDRILTEYRNQASTTSFYVIGPEQLPLTVSTSSVFVASSSYAYDLSYSYDALGNLLSNSDLGTYTYSQDGYANPHAVTQIASTTYIYDKSGNLIQSGGVVNGWDYRNRLASSTVNGQVIEYLYDYDNDRMKYLVGTTTIISPMKEFEIENNIPRRNIYLEDRLVASIESSGSTTEKYFILSDHLLSTSAVLDSYGNPIQHLDYKPFGDVNINQQSSTYNQSNKYLGEKYDLDSEYSYLNARYYEGSRGQFLSQDPVFWELGQTEDGKSALLNPQSQNSYSYAGNNPITFKDPTGRFWEVSFTAVAPSRAFSVGIKGDGNGMSGFASGGAGAGFSTGLGFGWSPNRELSHKNEGSINASGQAAAGVGLRVTQDLVSGSEGKYQTGGQNLVSVVVGGGAGASVQEEFSMPLITWSSARSELGSTANIPATISAPDPSTTYTMPGRFGGILGGVLNSVEKAVNKIKPTVNKSSNKQTKP